MASCEDHIEELVGSVKQMMLKLEGEDADPTLFVSPSAYDTAWLAMVPDWSTEGREERPMFEGCLDWILKNQRPEGFWGERDHYGYPTIDSLPSTLACMVALKTWGLGHDHIRKGLAFINSTSTNILRTAVEDNKNSYPRWFTIVFPAMLELARNAGLEVIFPDDVKQAIADVFRQRQHLLRPKINMEVKYDEFPPLLAYLEALPPSHQIDRHTILSNLDQDGSLFRSPSATAAAFLATRNHRALSYLCRLLPSSYRGVPATYPVDKDFIKVVMVTEIQSLGLSEHFSKEIKGISEHIYRKYNEEQPSQGGLAPHRLFKDSLAFQLLRQQGYDVCPERLCWFVNDVMALEYIEENSGRLSSVLYNLYKATNLMFSGESALQELRSFLRDSLQKSCLSTCINDDIIMWPHLQEVIKRELSIPWMARMDHLENRKWIEENNMRALWSGKASYYRISCTDSKDLCILAMENYKHRQSVYKKELEELLRWSKAWGLMDMDFAREKTVYLYFAVASSVSLPCDSDVRLIVAKSAILITVADDFFDMEGSLEDILALTSAVQRWDNKGLTSHSRTIFDALDSFVTEISEKYLHQHGVNITNSLREIWYQTFASWLTEATWSKTGEVPSMDSYIKTGMISIAAHILVLQASCALTPTILSEKLHPHQYEDITKFLMMSCRLLNDIQSYEKELKDGKNNSVMIYLKEHRNAKIEDAIHHVQSMLDEAKMKMLEHSLKEDLHYQEGFKKLHLGCLKVFQMFFNAANHFDSKESLLSDINKSIFIPLEIDEKNVKFQPVKSIPALIGSRSNKTLVTPALAPITNCYMNIRPQRNWRLPSAVPLVTSLRNNRRGMVVKLTSNLAFV